MQSFLTPFFQGLLAVLTVFGVGTIAGRFLKLQDAPWYWRVALSALLGQAAVNIIVESVLLSGHGGIHILRLVALLLMVLGMVGHLLACRFRVGSILARLLRQNKTISAIFVLAYLTNLIVALAPTTKIDELFYHMLVPQRIVEDGSLRFYRLPIEAAIVPQMHYPIALSAAHALGAPDSGNVLSLGFSLALVFFVIGFLSDAIGNERLALLCGALCSVGIYGAIWHTTGGSHALGDLALVVAVAGVLRPLRLVTAVGKARCALLLVTAAGLAASTKISLWPLSFAITLLIIWRAGDVQPKSRTSSWVLVGLACLPWIVLHAPLMIWTYRVSGSFWGPILPNLFGPSKFPPNLLALLEESRRINQTGLLPTLRLAAVELSPVFFLATLWLFWTALRGCRTSILVTALFACQFALIAWKLPHDFRFLGGLQYIVVIAAVLTLAKAGEDQESSAFSRNTWALLGERLENKRIAIVLALGVPWLGLQMFYARPFAALVGGLMPRDQFIERYVALARDFQILDSTLPKEAVLYCPNTRLPNFYAPRPVLLTLLDLRGDKPIYRLTLKPTVNSEPIDGHSSLNCGQTFYSSDRAVIETYRTPGKNPAIGSLTIQRCRIITNAAGSP